MPFGSGPDQHGISSQRTSNSLVTVVDTFRISMAVGSLSLLQPKYTLDTPGGIDDYFTFVACFDSGDSSTSAIMSIIPTSSLDVEENVSFANANCSDADEVFPN